MKKILFRKFLFSSLFLIICIHVNKTNCQINLVLGKIDSTLNTKKSKLEKPKLDSLPNFNIKKPNNFNLKPNPKFSGNLALEMYKTSFQNPRVINEAQYVRFAGSPIISLYNIPIKVDFYYTTENNNVFNTNRIKLSVDYQTLLENAKNQYKPQLNKAKLDLADTKNALDFNKLKLNELQNEIPTATDGLNYCTNQLNIKKNEFKTKYTDSLNQFKSKYTDSFNQLKTDTKQNVLDKTQQSKERIQDSLTISKLQIDSSKYTLILHKIDSTKQALNNYKNQLQTSYTKDSAKYTQVKELVNNPEMALKQMFAKNNQSKLFAYLKFLQSIQLGTSNPLIHSNSYYGSTVRGVYFNQSSNAKTIKVFAGFTNRISTFNYNRISTNFDRLAIGYLVKKEFFKHLSLSTFGHYCADPLVIKKMQIKSKIEMQNYVTGFGIAFKHQKLPNFDISIAQSILKRKTTYIIEQLQPAPKIKNIKLLNKSFLLLLSQKISKVSSLQLKSNFVGPAFVNFGNPFNRTNFLENYLQYHHQLFKKQVYIQLFYKIFQDNPLGQSIITNKITGYGASLQTAFKNKHIPNVQFSISPFEQGNNHPDTLFRVQNQMRIYQGSVNHNLTYKTITNNVNLNATQSYTVDVDKKYYLVQSISLSNTIEHKKGFTFTSAYTKLKTMPKIDSSNGGILSVKCGIPIYKQVKFVVAYSQSMLNNGAFRKMSSAEIKFKSKNASISIKAGSEIYNQYWGIRFQKAFWGLIKSEIYF